MAKNDVIVRPRDPEMASCLCFILSFYILLLFFIFIGKLSCKILALF